MKTFACSCSNICFGERADFQKLFYFTTDVAFNGLNNGRDFKFYRPLWLLQAQENISQIRILKNMTKQAPEAAKRQADTWKSL